MDDKLNELAPAVAKCALSQLDQHYEVCVESNTFNTSFSRKEVYRADHLQMFTPVLISPDAANHLFVQQEKLNDAGKSQTVMKLRIPVMDRIERSHG